MAQSTTRLRRLFGPIVRPALRAARGLAYRRQLGKGEAAGEFTYVSRPQHEATPALVEVRLPATFGIEEARELCRWQTLPEVEAVGFDAEGQESWRVNAGGPVPVDGGEALWFIAPGTPQPTYPAHLESAFLIAAAEEVDAVTLSAHLGPTPEAAEADLFPPDLCIDDLHGAGLRSLTLFRSAAFEYDGAEDRVSPTLDDRLAKVVDSRGALIDERTAARFNDMRRGPYLSSQTLGPSLEVGVADASVFERRPRETTREPLLVLTSFLARGGAEHTLFETLLVLRDRFEVSIVTLAPHRPELGDRRQDFRRITERILCLGDWVHPAAMPGLLRSLLCSTRTKILHNSNGTTLFYEFIPAIKQAFPELRVVDHLYDHQIGYIDRYQPRLKASVDACVAENGRIAQVLCEEREWPRERVPVIWPCGRRREVFPTGQTAVRLRRELRRKLRVAPEDLLILSAARMHPQKRPLDLVYLARRTQDLHQVHYLLVGGGELEEEVDAAIAAQPAANIRRLPFRTDIPELIIAADVGCLVSDYEGLPVFMLECLQAGRPFIGTDVGEMGHVLRHSGAGLVVEKPGDLEALEDQVRGLLDTSLWTDLAERAAQAGGRFDVEACAELYAAVFLGES